MWLLYPRTGWINILSFYAYWTQKVELPGLEDLQLRVQKLCPKSSMQNFNPSSCFSLHGRVDYAQAAVVSSSYLENLRSKISSERSFNEHTLVNPDDAFALLCLIFCLTKKNRNGRSCMSFQKRDHNSGRTHLKLRALWKNADCKRNAIWKRYVRVLCYVVFFVGSLYFTVPVWSCRSLTRFFFSFILFCSRRPNESSKTRLKPRSQQQSAVRF